MLRSSNPNSLALSLGNNLTLIGQNKRLGKFLQFQIGKSDKALLEAELVTEIITLSVPEILPVPQMPHCVLGVYSWRSEMLWIVDLENLLGYPPLSEISAGLDTMADNLMVMVLQVNGQSLGLIVPRVNEIIQQDWDELKAPVTELFSQDILLFLQGYFLDSKNEVLLLLKAEEIFAAF